MGRALYKAFLVFASQYFFIAFFVCTGCTKAESEFQQRKVYIKKEEDRYVLYRNNEPFRIKGAAGFSHIPALKQAGGNTIRTWDTVNIAAILDEALAHDIAVIVGFPMPESRYLFYYEDSAKVAGQFHAFKAIVERYKDHPAVLMWCLGNELHFPFKPNYRPFYQAFNNLLDMIHTTDPHHPVTTALLNFQEKNIINVRLKIPDLDVLSFNTFGRLATFRKELDNFAWFWNGPYFISEWGINGPWEEQTTAWKAPIENTSTKKGEQILGIHEQYMPVQDPRFLGACIFFWGQKQETTHTWFSIFSEEGYTSEAVHAMQNIWRGTKPVNQAPQIEYMLVGKKGAYDNIMVSPHTTQTAEVLMHEPDGDPVQVKWEVLPEDWYKINDDSRSKPVSVASTIMAEEGRQLQFRAPAQEGPYRIFVEVVDNQGNYATANTPIYVIE